MMRRQIRPLQAQQHLQEEWRGLGKGFIQEITEQRDASELVDIDRWGKRNKTIPDHMEQRHCGEAEGSSGRGQGQGPA